MSNEEIKFSLGGAVAYLKNGRLVYKKDTGGKLKNVLQPLFDAIAAKEVVGNNRKIEEGVEKDLLKNLQSIFGDDGDESISEDEITWAKGFQKDGDVAQFIQNKLDSIEAAKKAAKEAEDTRKAIAFLDETRAEAEAEIEKEEAAEKAAAEEAQRAAEAAAKAAAEKKKADRAAFDKSINKIKEGLSLEGVTSETYTIKKGDSFWRIAKNQLIAEGKAKPKNREIMERIALIALVNKIDSVTGKKLYPNKTILVPVIGAVTPQNPEPAPAPAATTETVTPATQAEMEEHNDNGEWNAVNDVKVYKDSSGVVHLVNEGGTPESGWTEVNASVWEDENGKKYYVETAAAEQPAQPAPAETVTQITQAQLDANEYDPVNDVKVYKDSSGVAHLVKDGETPDSSWTEVNASVWEDENGKKYYVEEDAAESSAQTAAAETVTQITQAQLDASEYGSVDNVKVYKDSSGVAHLVNEGETPDSSWTEVNASVWEDENGKKYYVEEEE